MEGGGFLAICALSLAQTSWFLMASLNCLKGLIFRMGCVAPTWADGLLRRNETKMLILMPCLSHVAPLAPRINLSNMHSHVNLHKRSLVDSYKYVSVCYREKINPVRQLCPR